MVFGLALSGFLLTLAPLAAQQSGATTKAVPTKRPAVPGSEAPTPAPRPVDARLQARLDALEQQMIDMQVAIGTFQSLGRAPTHSAGPLQHQQPSANGLGQVQIEALEVQVRGLTAQVEQLQQQVRLLELEGRRVDLPTPQRPLPPRGSRPAPPSDAGGSEATPGDDPIGRLLGSVSQPSGDGAPQRAASMRVDRGSCPVLQPAPSLPSGPMAALSSREAYERAYGHLLAQDYAAAENGFDDFVRTFPHDPLAGHAQYWLGETHYVRGQYRAAAAAFLHGYQTYATSPKAPDSVLKLAMSLDRLGQKDAACASFGELFVKYPSAPPHIRNRADSERRRLGCP